MIPIREAFDQIGLKRFPGKWNKKEFDRLVNWPTKAALDAFSPSERAVFDRCTSILTFLQQELVAGRAVITTTNGKHEHVEIPADYFRDSLYNGRLQDGAENLAEYLTDKRTSHFICLPEARGAGGRPGAPAQADWTAYQEAFNAKCDDPECGYPDELNVKGWQRQADVQRWLVGLTKRDGATNREGKPFDPKDTTIKNHAREFMVTYRNSKGTNS